MRVRFVREHSLQGAGDLGPTTRVFEVGEIVDVPDIHAQMWMASGDAVLEEQPADADPADDEQATGDAVLEEQPADADPADDEQATGDADDSDDVEAVVVDDAAEEDAPTPRGRRAKTTKE